MIERDELNKTDRREREKEIERMEENEQKRKEEWGMG